MLSSRKGFGGMRDDVVLFVGVRVDAEKRLRDGLGLIWWHKGEELASSALISWRTRRSDLAERKRMEFVE